MAKEKVLIVDDDQMIRWALNEALRNWGYACVEAETVSSALAAFDSTACARSNAGNPIRL
jgi:DNA-binding NtrC family response regulator